MIRTVVFALFAAVPAGCAQQELADLSCGSRVVNLNYERGARTESISVAPPHVRVCRRDTVTILITPPVGAMGARTRSVGSHPEDTSWLDRDSRDGSTIEITVSNEAVQGKTYKYSIEIDGVGLLDPSLGIIR